MEAGESSPPLKYKTWVLKVFIHCEACKKKVKRVLQSIDGVFTTTVDSVLQKVTVTGDVDAETLIRKLQKTGKHAELWPSDDKSGTKAGAKGGDSGGGKKEKGSGEKADEGAVKKPNGESGGKVDEGAEKKVNGGSESKEGAAKDVKVSDGAAKKSAPDEKPVKDVSPPDEGKAAEGSAGAVASAAGSGKKKGKKGKGNGDGSNGGTVVENSGNDGHPPAVSGATPAASKEGCGAVVAPAAHYPPHLIAPAPIGWNQWTPAVSYRMVAPAVSYEGSYTLPPYVDASMVPYSYSSGGVIQYVPPGCYPQREEEGYYDDVFSDENATGCSVM